MKGVPGSWDGWWMRWSTAQGSTLCVTACISAACKTSFGSRTPLFYALNLQVVKDHLRPKRLRVEVSRTRA